MKCFALENAVLTALADLITYPGILLAEAERFCDSDPSSGELAATLKALGDVEAQQRRLVRLFTEGELPTEILEEQRTELSTRRSRLEADRHKLEGLSHSRVNLEQIKHTLPELLRKVRQWVEEADGEKLELLLRAVDARIVACGCEVRISGSVPFSVPGQTQDLATIERTSA